MPDFDDVEIMSYADGELDPQRAAQIEAAALTDVRLRARIDTFSASRRILRERFAAVLDQPVPARLMRVLESAPPSPRATILSFRQPPGASPQPRRLPRLLMAASVAAAVGLGFWLRPAAVDDTPSGALALALETHVLETGRSGMPVRVSHEGGELEVLPLATFVHRDGRYCRDVEVSRLPDHSPAQRGLACRSDDGRWLQEPAIAQVTGNAGDAYVTASGGSSSTVLRRLGEAEEAAVLGAGWKP